LRTFIDNVAVLVVEMCLVDGLENIFNPTVVTLMDAEQIAQLASEKPTMTKRRIEAQEKKIKLVNASQNCRRHSEGTPQGLSLFPPNRFEFSSPLPSRPKPKMSKKKSASTGKGTGNAASPPEIDFDKPPAPSGQIPLPVPVVTLANGGGLFGAAQNHSSGNGSALGSTASTSGSATVGNGFGGPAPGTGASQPLILDPVKLAAGNPLGGFGTETFGGTSAAAPKSTGIGTGTFGAIPAATPSSGGLFPQSTGQTTAGGFGTRKGELPYPFPFVPVIEKDPSAINMTNVFESIHAVQRPELSFEIRWIPSITSIANFLLQEIRMHDTPCLQGTRRPLVII
jgi:hypothetical protein